MTVIALIIAAGLSFAIRRKPDQSGESMRLRRIGYSLLAMSLFLIVIGGLQLLGTQSLSEGH